MKVTIKTGNLKTLIKKLEQDEKAAQKVLKATGNDLRRRAPGKVADQVTTVYNIKKSEITPSGKGAQPKKKAGTVSVRGTTVSDVTLVYKGRMLTPTHFAMRPTKPQKRPKGKRRPKPITAEIKKGKRKSLGSNVFLGTNRGGGYIPFKRTTAKRYPIEVVKTVSMPQMVDNPAVRSEIRKDINELLRTRLNHNIKRFMK